MHRTSLKEGLTLYDSSMTEDERETVRRANLVHLITWVMNLLVLFYLIYKLIMEFESIFMGYVIFSCFALLVSLAYARRYKSWYGHNILVYFILFVFIVINILMFSITILAEVMPLEQYKRFRKGHLHWGLALGTILFFFVPVLHSV